MRTHDFRGKDQDLNGTNLDPCVPGPGTAPCPREHACLQGQIRASWKRRGAQNRPNAEIFSFLYLNPPSGDEGKLPASEASRRNLRDFSSNER